VWMLKPGERYFRHDRNSWPTLPELGFDICSEPLEDQLAAEAKAASPLYFEDDDKENEVNDGLEESHNPLDDMSIMPASQYRPPSEDRHALRETLSASGAFYDAEYSTPYGFGGNDGTHDQEHVTAAKPTPNAMDVLAMGGQLPGSSAVQKQADEIDSVLGLPSSNTAEELDSVCGC
jgi:hypothetical protein